MLEKKKQEERSLLHIPRQEGDFDSNLLGLADVDVRKFISRLLHNHRTILPSYFSLRYGKDDETPTVAVRLKYQRQGIAFCYFSLGHGVVAQKTPLRGVTANGSHILVPLPTHLKSLIFNDL